MSHNERHGAGLLALTILLALAVSAPACRRPATQAAAAPTATAVPTQVPPTAAPSPTPTQAAPAATAAARPARPPASAGAPTAPRPTAAPAPSVAPTAAPSGSGVPADHTKNRKGAMHKKGSHDATVNCTPCHGKDLKGDPPRPSCYSCHDKKWR